ncbi:MAG TPA: hypothetical protein VGS05_07760 [Candidatus Sulfotelmatobacter sp.]|nr:hypothetical protein [Candidatus Sulfotelmatobacter sp.]
MKTQAWGWLAAAVMAAGLNANYHDGGLPWAHQIVDRVTYNAGTVLALATGHIDQLQVRVLTAQNETTSCPLATALARVENNWHPSETSQENFELMSAREEAQFARLAADRARIEAQVARLRLPAVALSHVVMRGPQLSLCPRVHVNVPRLPAMKTPMVHLDLPTAGPA